MKDFSHNDHQIHYQNKPIAHYTYFFSKTQLRLWIDKGKENVVLMYLNRDMGLKLERISQKELLYNSEVWFKIISERKGEPTPFPIPPSPLPPNNPTTNLPSQTAQRQVLVPNPKPARDASDIAHS